MEYSKQLMGIVSEDIIFMESQLLKQLQLGSRFIYTEQTLQVKMLQFLLSAPKLRVSLL